jgi:regulator of nucleoside diphosphate kinase
MEMTEYNIAVDTINLKPEITLSTEDYVKLSALVRAAMNKMPELADGLSEELERAHIIEDEHLSTQTIRMGYEVDFRDDTTDKTQTVMLVYPAQADIVQGKVSVLTPIGTALIGLRAGQSISWNTRAGETRRLTVLGVRKRGAA